MTVASQRPARLSTGNGALDDVPLSVFDPIVAALRTRAEKPVIPLHQGKTAYTAPIELRSWKLDEFDVEAHHDGPSAGCDTLIAEVRQALSAQLQTDVDPARIQITNGITHGLSIVFNALLNAGDEVLVLSPHWLFAPGLVRAAGGVPVDVPFFSTGPASVSGSVVDRLAPYVTDRTRAVYFNAPNNPTGCSLPRVDVDEIVAFAVDRGLWLIADNAYEHFDFAPGGFVDPAALPYAADRTFATYSFSKSYGLTGYRIGYLLTPAAFAERARKFGLYSIYSVPTVSQFVATHALRRREELLPLHREFVRQALLIATKVLTIPRSEPEGGFYLLLELSAWEPGVGDFISRCIREGVSLAPGSAFGTAYGSHARLCYSVVSHDDLAAALGVVNSIYATGY